MKLILSPEFEAKLNAFVELLQRQATERRTGDWPTTNLSAETLACREVIIARDCKVKVTVGGKYIRVDLGDAGKYMIDAQGNIWGIKAYGVIHKGHQYGTLDTIHQFYWGGYKGLRISPKS